MAAKGYPRQCCATGPQLDAVDPSTIADSTQSKLWQARTHLRSTGQPLELGTAYVMLADPISSYVSGAPIAFTGGKAFP